MRLAGVLILAFVASAIAGALAYAAVSLLPDWDDAAGRGLGEAFRALLIAVYLILSMSAVWFGALAQRSRAPSEARAFHSAAGAASGRRSRRRQQWHPRHQLAAGSRWRGADVRAAVGGCAGAMADPA